MSASVCTIPFEIAPFRLTGAVYGTLLNHRSALTELGSRAAQPPYNAPPRAPVLYIKPRNTLAASGDAVEIPVGMSELEVGPCLGLVIGRTACRVPEEGALHHVAGYLLVTDVSVPHDPFYRPSIRCKARDGFCPMGPAVVPRDAIVDPDAPSFLREVRATAGSLEDVFAALTDGTSPAPPERDREHDR